MSVEAIAWALEQRAPSQPAKHVLLVLADRAHRDTLECFPSAAYLVEVTQLSRRSVLKGLAQLRRAGLIEDTGGRRGATGSIPVYRLRIEEAGSGAPRAPLARGSSAPDAPQAVHQMHEAVHVSARSSAPRAPGTVREPLEPRSKASAQGARANFAGAHLNWPTTAGTACRLMRQAGCGLTNPSHPDLLAALAEGVTAEVLAATAAEAVEAGKSKPFAWAITAARSRHAEGAKPVATGPPRQTHAAPSKTLQGIQALEAMKPSNRAKQTHEQPRRLAAGSDADRVAEAADALARSLARG